MSIWDCYISAATTIIIGQHGTTISGMVTTTSDIVNIFLDTDITTGMTNIMALAISVGTIAHVAIVGTMR